MASIYKMLRDNGACNTYARPFLKLGPARAKAKLRAAKNINNLYVFWGYTRTLLGPSLRKKLSFPEYNFSKGTISEQYAELLLRWRPFIDKNFDTILGVLRQKTSL